jgi:hypothetical protein
MGAMEEGMLPKATTYSVAFPLLKKDRFLQCFVEVNETIAHTDGDHCQRCNSLNSFNYSVT